MFGFPMTILNIQGDVIKEGQTIGYLDQFGTELPVKVRLFSDSLILVFAFFIDFLS